MAGASSIEPGKVRPTAVAGQFYPAEPMPLRGMVERFLSLIQPDTVAAPKAIIVPHAGYVFSGPIAASAYARLAPARNIIRRVVLVGPSHFVSFAGLATTSAEAFATPLGLVPVDREAVRQICAWPQVTVLDEAHAHEHALEVQLPFLQVVLGQFRIVPLVVNEASDEAVAQLMDALWGGPETLYVISSDLSHYHTYPKARELDSATCRAIEQLRPQDIQEEQACGGLSIRGWLHAARQHGLCARAVDLRNSGDTAGPRDQVVGYGAFVFEENP